MKPVNMKPFSIEGSVSADQCALLRDYVEGVAVEAVERQIANAMPLPGVAFYQLQSSFDTVTYMILDEVAYCYERHESSWHRMMVPASHIREAKDLIRRVA